MGTALGRGALSPEQVARAQIFVDQVLPQVGNAARFLFSPFPSHLIPAPIRPGNWGLFPPPSRSQRRRTGGSKAEPVGGIRTRFSRILP